MRVEQDADINIRTMCSDVYQYSDNVFRCYQYSDQVFKCLSIFGPCVQMIINIRTMCSDVYPKPKLIVSTLSTALSAYLHLVISQWWNSFFKYTFAYILYWQYLLVRIQCFVFISGYRKRNKSRVSISFLRDVRNYNKQASNQGQLSAHINQLVVLVINYDLYNRSQY